MPTLARQSSDYFFANRRKNFSPFVGEILRYSSEEFFAIRRKNLVSFVSMGYTKDRIGVKMVSALSPSAASKIKSFSDSFPGMQNVYNNCSASCAIHIINLPSPRGSISTCWFTRRSRPRICRARNWQNYPRRWKPSSAQGSQSWYSNRDKKRNKDDQTCRRLRANHRHIFFQSPEIFLARCFPIV